ncbi:MAG: hypothetical protein EXQ88_05390 [Alphaproteobacteria bacterium]|nr:hypothetical protein [Alphaproteobacteria bacterium]
MERLFTVTRNGTPIAMVLARDFAEAVQIASAVCTFGLDPANDAPKPARIRPEELKARRVTDDEGFRFAAAAASFTGEARLAAIPL